MKHFGKSSFWFLSLSYLLVCVSLSSCGESPGVRSIKQESLYDRVIRAGKIRCAYFIYPPYSVKDPNSGKINGVGTDALQLVADKLGLKLEIVEEVGWGNMVEGLQTNRYDIVASPVWTNANRARVAGFSKPLFYSPIFAYIKKGNHRLPNRLEKLNSPDVTIATIDGETAQVIAESEIPKAKKLSMPQMTDCSQMLLNVATGKADLTFMEPTLAYLYMKNNPNSLEPLEGGRPIRLFPNCWMFRRGEYEFKAMLDTVLDEVINSGEMDRIIAKYELAPNLIYRVASPFRQPLSLQTANKSGSTLAQ
jgi:ABC-type amino acid transport substrate-binding protein